MSNPIRTFAVSVRASTCNACGTEFSYDYRGGAPRRYCDADANLRVVDGSTRRAYGRRRPRRAPESRPCDLCQGMFVPARPHQRYCPGCVTNKGERAHATRYGVSAVDVERLKARFGGLCWVCRQRRGDSVDHDHATGQVRGWLCRPCNGALHYVERPDWMSRALAYLANPGVDEVTGRDAPRHGTRLAEGH